MSKIGIDLDRAGRRRAVLQAFMDARGLNVNAWSKVAKVPEASFRQFMAGRTYGLNITTYERLAEAVGVSVGTLLGEAPLSPVVDIAKLRAAVRSVVDGFRAQGVNPSADLIAAAIANTYEIISSELSR